MATHKIHDLVLKVQFLSLLICIDSVTVAHSSAREVNGSSPYQYN
ncbi:MAG: hypothetical protein ACFFG0_02245 [Candidatus Thorarchaeota archaeon]